jgi:hypothetical protein
MSEKDKIPNKYPVRKRRNAKSERERKRAKKLSHFLEIASYIFASATGLFVLLSIIFAQHFERLITAAPICWIVAMTCEYFELHFLYEASSE